MHNDEQLTTAEAAELLRVHVATVNRWAQDGRLPPIQKLPGLRGPNLFRRADVEDMRDQLAKESA